PYARTARLDWSLSRPAHGCARLGACWYTCAQIPKYSEIRFFSSGDVIYVRPLLATRRKVDMQHVTKLMFRIAVLSVFWLVGCGTMPAAKGGHDATEDGHDATEGGHDADASVMPNCATNLVPVMTRASSPSGMVSRSGAYDASYEAWQAFDASDNSMWISGVFETPAWIAYQWTDGRRPVTSYAIDFVNGSLTSRAPRDWTFEGWDGAWHVID